MEKKHPRSRGHDRPALTPHLQRRALDAVLRSDFNGFLRKVFETVSPGDAFSANWHIEAMAHELGKLSRGETRRLIINVPPRMMKSICASVALPAFLLGRDPTQRVICVSYSEELAKKFSNDFRAVLRSDWYQRVFPATRIDRSKDTETEVQTTMRGYRLATSPGGTLTGRGGDAVIIDDPIKPADADSKPARAKVIEWVRNTLLSRFDHPGEGTLALVMQRVHVEDLAGALLESGTFEHLCLPAIAESDKRVEIGPGRFHLRRAGDLLDPSRLPQAVLDEIRSEMGSMHFNAQYQQAPVPVEGNLIKQQWLKFASPPAQDGNCRLVLSWDTAMKAGELSDYSVCTVWQEYESDYYLLHVFRDRLDYPDLKRKAVELHRRWSPCVVLIEDHGSGTSLIQDLKRERIRAIARKPEGDKVVRMSAQSAKFEAGHVFILRDQAWFEDLKAELLAFPSGRHDDQVDSISQALAWFSRDRRVVRSGTVIGDY
jgi:predicted phage terminase large subunit-like protein